VALDQGHLGAQSGRAGRAHQTGRSGADDHQVVARPASGFSNPEDVRAIPVAGYAIPLMPLLRKIDPACIDKESAPLVCDMSTIFSNSCSSFIKSKRNI
jgi:hypothetical protein